MNPLFSLGSMSDDKPDSLDTDTTPTPSPPPSPTHVPVPVPLPVPVDGPVNGPDDRTVNGPVNEPDATGPSNDLGPDTGTAQPPAQVPPPAPAPVQVPTVNVPVLPQLVLQPVPVPVSVLSLPGLLPVLVDTTIIDFSFNEFVDGSGVRITNQKGKNEEGDIVTKTLLDTLDASANLQVTEDLSQIISTYDGPNGALVAEIRKYASEIQCSKF